MRRIGVAAILLALLSLRGNAASDPERLLWFCPGPGTLDFVRLFDHPEEWRHARELMDVFKFYQQHTQTPTPSIVGPNSYDALARAGVFRKLTDWRKKIAIEVPAVKDYYCTAGASGMNASIAATTDAVAAVERGGGRVTYLAMDEPFAAGQAPVCGGPALDPTADRVNTYVKGVKAARPNVSVGLIEAYPYLSEEQIESAITLLRAKGASPAFLHIDIDLNAVKVFRTDLVGDLRRLKGVCASQNLPFGVIIWGNNGDADLLYTLDAGRLFNAVAEAFPSSSEFPEHVIVQSWAESRTGLRITPTNLPENEPYTHASLLWDVFRRVKGLTGPSSGTAAVRR